MSNGSAFDPVSHLRVPLATPWGHNMGRQEVMEPPKLSVTAPVEDSLPIQVDNSAWDRARMNDRVTCPYQSSKSPEMPPSEEIFHKKFDKFRKLMPQPGTEEARQMENLSLNDERMHNEVMVVDSEDEREMTASSFRGSAEQHRKSAVESHPQLLAQLKSGPQFKPVIYSAFPTMTAGPSFQNVQNHSSASLIKHESSTTSPSAMETDMVIKSSGGNFNPGSGVVLSVPQTLYPVHSPPSIALSNAHSNAHSNAPPTGQSLMSSHPCLQNILHSDSSSHQNRPGEMHFPQEKLLLTTAITVKGNELQRKVQNSEGLASSQSSTNKAGNNDSNGHFRNGHAQSGGMFGGRFGPRPPMENHPPQALVNQYLLYQQMYPQIDPQQMQSGMAAYNKHLAGMQQMVYGGNPATMRR